MDLKKWKIEESEPWENMGPRVVDAAEAVGCEEALDYDTRNCWQRPRRIPTSLNR